MLKDGLYSVDRIEEDVAVLVNESGCSYSVLLAELPPNITAGKMVRREQDAYYLDEEATEQRRSYVLSLQEKLLRKKD